MASPLKKRRSLSALGLASAWVLASWALLGCAGVLGVKDTSFKDKAASLEAQSAFYAALIPFIEPAPKAKSEGRAVVLAPTQAVALRILDDGRRCAADDCEYAARGLVEECRLLSEVLDKRGLFAGVDFKESETPPEAAPALAMANAAVIYLDARERAWFYLPQNGGQADRLSLGMYLAQTHAEVRAWLSAIEEFLARPPLVKAPAPAPAPGPPPAKPAKALGKEAKAPPRELPPAPFGLMWRAGLADLRRLKAKLGPPSRSGDMTEYMAQVTPQRPEDTEKIRLSLHKAHGLQKIVWRDAPVNDDPFGFLGRERFRNLQSVLEKRYGPPSKMVKYLNETRFKSRDQFYSCLGQAACGNWAVYWKLTEMSVALELTAVREGVGVVVLTYQGPDWDKILDERRRLEQERLKKAIKP